MDNTKETVTTSEDNGNQKEAKKRMSYVAKDHRSMMEFVAGVYRNLGHTDYHSNKEIATVHQLSPDSIKQHLTSSQQYKLLELKFGVGYKITDLFKRIFLPVNDAEQKAAIIESLKSPDTYQPLFKEYEFHILPPLSGIKNHFVRNHHFKEEIAEKTAQIFLDNLTTYGLIDTRGVLTSGMKVQSVNKPEVNGSDKPVEQKEEKQEKQESNKYQPNSNEIEVTIPLKTKSPARLILPSDYTDEDLDRIGRFVVALKD